MRTLEGNSLSSINTWANADEQLTSRIADGPNEQKVYAAHIIAAATITMANSSDITNITNLAISSINKLFVTNPMWLGVPVRYSSSIYIHDMIAGFSYGLPSK